MEAMDTSGGNVGRPAGGSGFLARYFDAGMAVPEDLTPEVVKGDEIGRLSRTLAVVIYSSSLPRRLGGDATDEELALDKKRGRRASWALSQSLKSWSGRIPKLDAPDDVRREGAQLDWPKFKAEHAVQINTRLRLVSTWALMRGDRELILFGNKAVVKLQNELNWVSYALRD